MTRTRILRLPSRLPSSIVLLAAALMHATPGCANTIDYEMNIDTSSLGSTSLNSGYIDFQFDPGSLPGTQFAAAEIVQPTCNCSFSTATVTGDVFDGFHFRLGGVLFNDTPNNDIFLPIQFSGDISFEVTVSGDAVDNPDPNAISGSTFVVSVYSGRRIEA
jgi:hypothetical protein